MKNDDGALSFGTAIDMSGFDAGIEQIEGLPVEQVARSSLCGYYVNRKIGAVYTRPGKSCRNHQFGHVGLNRILFGSGGFFYAGNTEEKKEEERKNGFH